MESDPDEDDSSQQDVVTKHQFTNNQHTCMANNYPETEVDKDGRNVVNQQELFLHLQKDVVHPTFLMIKIGISKVGPFYFQMENLAFIIKER